MTANSYAEFPRLFVVCPEESNTSPQETFTCSGVTLSLAYLLLHCHCHPQHHCPQPPPPLTTTNHPSPLTTIANYKYFWIKKKLLLLKIRNYVGKYLENSIIQHYILNIFFS
jgi:hypothetical protein